MGRFVLCENYPEFLEKTWRQALRALIAVCQALQNEEMVLYGGTPPAIEVFQLNGKAALIKADNGRLWEENHHHNDDLFKMLGECTVFMRQIANDADKITERQELIDFLIANNSLATFWRKLLAASVATTKKMAL